MTEITVTLEQLYPDPLVIQLAEITQAPASSGPSGGSSLPTGGATGQPLVKNSGTDGDAGWNELSADHVADGTTNKAYTTTEKTKLGNIANAATKNATDAQLRDRSTHTGTQLSSTISDFNEAAQDAVATMLVSGGTLTLVYNDASNTLTVTGTGTDAEAVRDTIGAAIVGINGISVSVNDALDTITLSISGLTAGQVSGLAAVATSGSAEDLTEGTTKKLLTTAERAAIAANSAALADPKTRLLAVSTPAVTGTNLSVGTTGVVNTTAETDLFNLVIPAGVVAVGDLLESDLAIDGFNGFTSNVTITLRVYLGGSLLFNNNVAMQSSGSARHRIPVRMWMVTQDLVSVWGAGWMLASTAVGNTNMAGLLAVGNQGAGTINGVTVPDLSAGATLRVTGQLATANVNTDVRGTSAILKRVRV